MQNPHLQPRRAWTGCTSPAHASWRCHTQEEVRHAGALGLDFIVVSPVQQTTSHPGAQLLGFGGLQHLTEQALLPVYALGGMQLSDMDAAFRHGAQGIAAISGLWDLPASDQAL